jgi:hypothetical protein
MKEIKNHFEHTGSIETYVGEIMLLNDSLVLPVFNSQLTQHPLNKTNDSITNIDYCYYVFFGVTRSSRDVYTIGHKSQTPIKQTNIFRKKLTDQESQHFLLEFIDYNEVYQYWNWVVEAKSFSLIVEDDFNLSKHAFEKTIAINSFFEQNHIEILGNALNLF